MFRNNFDTYYHGIRQVSDELCRENRLSVIETDGKGKSYDECYMLDQADRHPGAEHGTAKWGSAHRLNIKYRNTKDPKENYILTENVRFSTDSHAHKHMANTCPQTKEQKMQRQKARSEIANAKPKGKRQVKASQGNTSYGKMVKQDKPFVKKQNTHTEQKPTAK